LKLKWKNSLEGYELEEISLSLSKDGLSLEIIWGGLEGIGEDGE
jgi:hypothetical protein